MLFSAICWRYASQTALPSGLGSVRNTARPDQNCSIQKKMLSIDDLSMIEPCFAMNGHPRARVKLILRQCETPVKIYNSRWFPASSKWSIIAGQGSNIKNRLKNRPWAPGPLGHSSEGPKSIAGRSERLFRATKSTQERSN